MKLMDALRDYGDLEVETEGCDCVDTAGGIEVEGDAILITRGGSTVPPPQYDIPDPLKDYPEDMKP